MRDNRDQTNSKPVGRRLRWLCLCAGLVLLVPQMGVEALGVSRPDPGGPWMSATAVADCHDHNPLWVCAEWPFKNGGSVVCCIEFDDLGTKNHPNQACRRKIEERDPDGVPL